MSENTGLLSRRATSSYADHVAHVQNILNKDQIQYMTFEHSYAWTFGKQKKRNNNYITSLYNCFPI